MMLLNSDAPQPARAQAYRSKLLFDATNLYVLVTVL